MRRHTVIGERIIRAAPSLAHAAELVRYSHERFDGAGYPDALSRRRDPPRRQHHRRVRRLRRDGLRPPYRQALSLADAMAELRSCAGTQFHPGVVEAFCTLVGQRAPAAAA